MSAAGSIVMAVAGSAPAYSIAATTAILVGAAGLGAPGVLLWCGIPMLGIAWAFLYLGRIDQKQLFAAANTAPDRKKRKGQLCEANFYAGEAAALQNRLGDAHDLLDAAVDQCPPTFFEARAAGAERTRLNR